MEMYRNDKLLFNNMILGPMYANDETLNVIFNHAVNLVLCNRQKFFVRLVQRMKNGVSGNYTCKIMKKLKIKN
jgi:hypothetical protein